jgi:hypothetical protein
MRDVVIPIGIVLYRIHSRRFAYLSTCLKLRCVTNFRIICQIIFVCCCYLVALLWLIVIFLMLYNYNFYM